MAAAIRAGPYTRAVTTNATAPIVRRALATFESIDPGDAVWRGYVGTARQEIAVDTVTRAEGRPLVVVSSIVGDAADVAPAALLLENDGLLFGRFRTSGEAIVVESALLGGHTLDEQEVRVVAFWIGWAAPAFRARFAVRAAGGTPDSDVPHPPVPPRRGVEERLTAAEDLVTRYLTERHGSFEHDPHWGHHAAFGSSRVFVSVRHTLEVSTAVMVAAPVLSRVPLSDDLARAVAAIADPEPQVRFAYAEDRAELWLEATMPGDDLDADELDDAVRLVGDTADRVDDDLRARFGGERYRDLIG